MEERRRQRERLYRTALQPAIVTASATDWLLRVQLASGLLNYLQDPSSPALSLSFLPYGYIPSHPILDRQILLRLSLLPTTLCLSVFPTNFSRGQFILQQYQPPLSSTLNGSKHRSPKFDFGSYLFSGPPSNTNLNLLSPSLVPSRPHYRFKPTAVIKLVTIFRRSSIHFT